MLIFVTVMKFALGRKKKHKYQRVKSKIVRPWLAEPGSMGSLEWRGGGGRGGRCAAFCVSMFIFVDVRPVECMFLMRYLSHSSAVLPLGLDLITPITLPKSRIWTGGRNSYVCLTARCCALIHFYLWSYHVTNTSGEDRAVLPTCFIGDLGSPTTKSDIFTLCYARLAHHVHRLVQNVEIHSTPLN